MVCHGQVRERREGGRGEGKEDEQVYVLLLV